MSEQTLLPIDPPEVDRLAREGAWRPRTISDIEWALEMTAESEAEAAEIDKQLAEVIARAKARAEHIKQGATQRASFFKAVVAEFAEQFRSDLLVGKKKSRDFISGRIGWRKKGGRLKVEDPKALETWLTSQDPKFSRVTVEPEMKVLQEHAKATGEIPPGCVWDEERDEVYVEAHNLMLPGEGKP